MELPCKNDEHLDLFSSEWGKSQNLRRLDFSFITNPPLLGCLPLFSGATSPNSACEREVANLPNHFLRVEASGAALSRGDAFSDDALRSQRLVAAEWDCETFTTACLDSKVSYCEAMHFTVVQTKQKSEAGARWQMKSNVKTVLIPTSIKDENDSCTCKHSSWICLNIQSTNSSDHPMQSSRGNWWCLKTCLLSKGLQTYLHDWCRLSLR